MRILSGLEWEYPDLFRPHLSYLSQLDGRLAKVDGWLVIAPQLSRSSRIEASILGSPQFSLVRRSRQAGKTAFGRIASVEHRIAAMQLIQGAGSDGLSIGSATGVVLLYPVIEGQNDADTRTAAPQGVADPSKVIMAFTLIPPSSATDASKRLLRFRAKDSGRANDIFVAATFP